MAPGRAAQRDAEGKLVLDGEGEPVLVETDPRWVGSGRRVLDNRGNPVKPYEPYFSSLSAFEDETELVEHGVTPVLHYDPRGRVVRKDLPNGTHERTEYGPWKVVSWDANDTAHDPDDAAKDTPWYTQRVAYIGTDPARLAEKDAAAKAGAHAKTPTTVHLDPLGRTLVSLAHAGFAGDDAVEYETRTTYDIAGKLVQVDDARGNVAQHTVYAMGGAALKTTSVDAGRRWARLPRVRPGTVNAGLCRVDAASRPGPHRLLAKFDSHGRT